MTTPTQPPPLPLKRVKTFGTTGEQYKIVRYTRQLANGDWMVEVSLLESGELAEYPWTDISDDPFSPS